ncbi:Cation/H(+) antiporter 15 [Sesamum angolense]|uniref:Cation/H(+) antiporter 15 n=1 Tax=Sesamum angolense TaxID=2727404 RepID=A0AAE2C3I6_9LAMI|nr:Cation/H(+) antiporter 15 [Sesamum angolense]
MNASSSPPSDSFCFVLKSRWSRGIFFGDNPFSSNTSVLLAQLTLCALTTAVLNRGLTYLGQSLFVSQILVRILIIDFARVGKESERLEHNRVMWDGVILGPSVLGSNAVIRELLFPVSSFYTVDTFRFFGVMFYLFIVGVKMDLSLIQKSGKKAVVIGICTFSIPLFLNLMTSRLITMYVAMQPRLYSSMIWIVSFQALSSFHVIVCLLADLKLMNSELGKLAISSSMISGICSFFWALVIFAGEHGQHVEQQTFIVMLIWSGIMVIFAICIFRPMIQWMTKHSTDVDSVKESYICAILILVLGSALYGEYLGQHFTFGPIVLGIVIPDGPPIGSALVNKLELFVSSIFLPIFFVVSAARIDFSMISLRNFAIIEGLAVCAFFWKVVGVMLPSLSWKMTASDALHLALVLSNQGMVEVLILEQAKSIRPTKRYMIGERMTIKYTNPNAEIRMLACLHYQEHTPSIINLFEASYPHPEAPISFVVVHLIELAGRSAPVLVPHHPGIPSPSNESNHIINALRYFEHENGGYVAVYPYTSISPYNSIHNDVCLLAIENRVSLVIVLFHKHPLIHVCEEETNAIRNVNHNIIRESPSSVGILVDRGTMTHTSTLLRTNVYRIGMIFLGGPDDREALAYACRMGKHPNIRITLIRFLDDSVGPAVSRQMLIDLNTINAYRDAQMTNKQWFYQEELVKDSLGLITVITSMESCFDLTLVGRRHREDSPLLAGLRDWNEFPELGCVGDMLVSLDSNCRASVLVVQQPSSFR